MLAKPTPRQLGGALVCFVGAAASFALESEPSLRHAFRWDSALWLLSGCGAMLLVRRLETQVIARAILAFTCVIALLGCWFGGFSSMRTVLLVATLGPLLVSRADGLDDDLRGKFRPIAHRGRLLAAAAICGVIAGLVALFGAHFLQRSFELRFDHAIFHRWSMRMIVLGSGFATSALAIGAGFLALLRLRTFGLALIFAGEVLALALAIRGGHFLVKPIVASLIGWAMVAQAVLLLPFLVGAARRLVISR